MENVANTQVETVLAARKAIKSSVSNSGSVAGVPHAGRRTGVRLRSAEITQDEDHLDNVDAYWKAAAPPPKAPRPQTPKNIPAQKKIVKSPTFNKRHTIAPQISVAKQQTPVHTRKSIKPKEALPQPSEAPQLTGTIQSAEPVQHQEPVFVDEVPYFGDSIIDIPQDHDIPAIDDPVIEKPKKRKSIKKTIRERSIIEIGKKIHSPEPSGGPEHTRKSQRKKFKPLAFWENERFRFGRRESTSFLPVPVVLDIAKGSEHLSLDSSAQDRPVKAKLRERKPRSNPLSGYDAYPGGQVHGAVLDSNGLETAPCLLMATSKGMSIEPVDTGIRKATSFSTENFSSGILSLAKKSTKSNTNSGDSILFFHVIQGSIKVSVHGTSFLAPTGSQFIVPAGNQYELGNVQAKEAKLVFCAINRT